MGDHCFDRLTNTFGREVDITGDPLRNKFTTLDRLADALFPVDEKNSGSSSGRSLSSTRTSRAGPDDDDIIGFGFWGFGFRHGDISGRGFNHGNTPGPFEEGEG